MNEQNQHPTNDSLFPKAREFAINLVTTLRKTLQENRRDVRVAKFIALAGAAVIVLVLLYMIRTDPKWARLFRQPIPVETMPVKFASFREVIGAGGSIEQGATVSITAKITQRVSKLAVDIGQVVQKGDLLIQWDDRVTRAAFENADTNEKNAKRALERQQILRDKGFASALDVENAQAAYGQAHQLAATAQIDLENTTLCSPATALVLDRNVNQGETTKLDAPLMTLGALDFVYLNAQVSEDKLSSIRLGLPADVTVDAFPGRIFHGTIVRVQPQIASSTRTFNAYVKIMNPDTTLKPGAIGYTRITNTRMSLAVPTTATINSLGEAGIIYVVDSNSIVHVREVRCGLSIDGWTEVLYGLQEGEKVIAVGQQEIVDGSHVRENQYTKAKSFDTTNIQSPVTIPTTTPESRTPPPAVAPTPATPEAPTAAPTPEPAPTPAPSATPSSASTPALTPEKPAENNSSTPASPATK